MQASIHWWEGFRSRPGVMGVLNVTPDSFSDGGVYSTHTAAIAAAHAMIAAGAAIIDVGGESTRPGAIPVTPEDEQARILPVISAMRDAGVPLSIDTRNASTMEAALDAGATIVNDVSGLSYDPAAAALVAQRGCPVVVMHMRGTPDTMASLAQYDDTVADILCELTARIVNAQRAGVALGQIAVDPGIGFAKDDAQNVAVLRSLRRFEALGRPLVVGVSRKRFIGTLSGARAPSERDAGSLAAGLFAVGQGARILRVHDVASTVQALRVWQALAG
jgi:dihydropteroate synthase